MDNWQKWYKSENRTLHYIHNLSMDVALVYGAEVAIYYCIWFYLVCLCESSKIRIVGLHLRYRDCNYRTRFHKFELYTQDIGIATIACALYVQIVLFRHRIYKVHYTFKDKFAIYFLFS
jgi:hypothetical protein